VRTFKDFQCKEKHPPIADSSLLYQLLDHISATSMQHTVNKRKVNHDFRLLFINFVENVLVCCFTLTNFSFNFCHMNWDEITQNKLHCIQCKLTSTSWKNTNSQITHLELVIERKLYFMHTVFILNSWEPSGKYLPNQKLWCWNILLWPLTSVFIRRTSAALGKNNSSFVAIQMYKWLPFLKKEKYYLKLYLCSQPNRMFEPTDALPYQGEIIIFKLFLSTQHFNKAY
jgi:hypothetical protein